MFENKLTRAVHLTGREILSGSWYQGGGQGSEIKSSCSFNFFLILHLFMSVLSFCLSSCA